MRDLELIDKTIFIAGAGGMVGSSVTHHLCSKGYKNLLRPRSSEVDLLNQSEVQRFFSSQRPHIVLLAAARVGGILANDTLRAQFIYENLMIESNVIHAAYEAGTEKLILLGSSCIYPR